MDNVDFLYVRIRMEELLARMGESETLPVHAGGLSAAKPDSVAPHRGDFWGRLRRAIQRRRRSIRVLPDSAR